MYALACLIGTLGLAVLAFAPDALIGGIGVLLVSGISFSVTRTVSVVWVNRRTTSDMRATVHSFLSQAESVGEVLGGFSLAVVARAAGIVVVLITAGALLVLVSAMVAGRRVVRRGRR
jgi:predicted MFS family arabinose efflux permease